MEISAGIRSIIYPMGLYISIFIGMGTLFIGVYRNLGLIYPMFPSCLINDLL